MGLKHHDAGTFCVSDAVVVAFLRHLSGVLPRRLCRDLKYNSTCQTTVNKTSCCFCDVQTAAHSGVSFQFSPQQFISKKKVFFPCFNLNINSCLTFVKANSFTRFVLEEFETTSLC